MSIIRRGNLLARQSALSQVLLLDCDIMFEWPLGRSLLIIPTCVGSGTWRWLRTLPTGLVLFLIFQLHECIV